jgi:hypothetical protein
MPGEGQLAFERAQIVLALQLRLVFAFVRSDIRAGGITRGEMASPPRECRECRSSSWQMVLLLLTRARVLLHAAGRRRTFFVLSPAETANLLVAWDQEITSAVMPVS